MKRLFLKNALTVATVALIAFLPVIAQATESLTAVLVKSEKASKSEPRLAVQFSNSKLEVIESIQNGERVYDALVEGYFTQANGKRIHCNLLANDDVFSEREASNFKGKIRLHGKVTLVNFITVDSLGNVTRGDFGIIFDLYDDRIYDRLVTAKVIRLSSEKNFHVTAGLGVSRLAYNESLRGNINQISLTAKISTDQQLGLSRWSLGGNAYSTLSAISKSTASSVQVFGANFRAGYLLPWLKNPWAFRIYSGLYYTTTYGGSGDFGYSNLAGVQIYPTLTYNFQNSASLGGYFKYSPLASGFKLYSLKNSEFALGVNYYFCTFKSSFLRGTSLGLTSDFSWLTLKTDALGGVAFQTMSFGMALRF